MLAHHYFTIKASDVKITCDNEGLMISDENNRINIYANPEQLDSIAFKINSYLQDEDSK